MGLACCMLLSWSLLAVAGLEAPASVAFWYGADPPVDALGLFDWVVVEPDHFTAADLGRLRAQGAEPFAYVGLGEVSDDRPWSKALDSRWILGRNPAWHSRVMDLSAPGWRRFLVERRFAPLWHAGYHAFFLDTLDSYQAVLPKARWAAQVDGLVRLVRLLHQRFPGIRLLPNRGFAALDRIAHDCVGLVAESLFAGWNAAEHRYEKVPAAARDWLLQRLRHARDDLKLPVVVVDYLPPARREQARALARRIAGLGFLPWVATPDLASLGVGSQEIMPRDVLLLYDAPPERLPYTDIHRFLALPLEYLGYHPVYRALEEGLPRGVLRGRYAGVVLWPERTLSHPRRLEAWLAQRVREGTPFLVLGQWGFQPSDNLLKELGISRSSAALGKGVRIARRHPAMGFEARPRARRLGVPGYRAVASTVHSWLRLQDAAGHHRDPVLVAPWGGMALAPYLLASYQPLDQPDDAQDRWIPDPFALLRSALHLPRIPVPDVTTENGRRLLTIHIDGDGFYNRSEVAGHPFSGQVILDRILRRFHLPHTVSVIEGEIGPDGLRPDLSPRLEAIARRIFRLPWVEAASHTYSHPFDWARAVAAAQDGTGAVPAGSGRAAARKDAYKAGPGHYHLPIPGYRLSLEREVAGSIAYIDRRLLPPGKKVRVMLWSGDALPTERALAIAVRVGVANLNGGDTTIDRSAPLLSRVSPMGRPLGRWYQPYAPVQNENIFTHEWLGPYWGYRRVIEAFELTDRPRRLKPISIYYHFYSGAKVASLRALETVYRWVLKQRPLPLWISEYVTKPLEFQHTALARRADGSWLIGPLSAQRSLRVPRAWGTPDLEGSVGLAGWRDLPQGRYLALDGRPRVLLRFRPGGKAQGPRLQAANARIRSWWREADGLRFRLSGHVPVRLVLAGAGGCRADRGRARRRGDRLVLSFRHGDTGDVRLRCR